MVTFEKLVLKSKKCLKNLEVKEKMGESKRRFLIERLNTAFFFCYWNWVGSNFAVINLRNTVKTTSIQRSRKIWYIFKSLPFSICALFWSFYPYVLRSIILQYSHHSVWNKLVTVQFLLFDNSPTQRKILRRSQLLPLNITQHHVLYSFIIKMIKILF